VKPLIDRARRAKTDLVAATCGRFPLDIADRISELNGVSAALIKDAGER